MIKNYHVLLLLILGLPFNSFSQITFETHVITTSADFAAGVSAADMDQDGDMDVLSADFLAGSEIFSQDFAIVGRRARNCLAITKAYATFHDICHQITIP